MSGFYEVTTSGVHPNAFSTLFLRRLAERDEPPTAGDADVAGPWRIEPIPGHGFGLFLQPMTMDLGWGRETFAFAIAVQNLVWGAAIFSTASKGVLVSQRGWPSLRGASSRRSPLSRS